MSSDGDSNPFDAYYFAHGCAASYERSDDLLRFLDKVAEQIAVGIQPATVLDAGCAMGFLVESLRKRGTQAFGVDVSAYAIQNVQPEISPYCWIGSVVDPFPARYDLIVSIEVLEHMPQAQAEQAVANFCQHTRDILFSSTPFDYKEVTHFNVQPPEYWAEQFARQGFYRDVDFDASFITPWAVRFRLRSDPPARLARDYERKFWLLWKENTDLRTLTVEMRDQLQAADQELQTLRQRLAEKDLTKPAQAAQAEANEAAYRALTAEVDDRESSLAWRVVRAFWSLRLKMAPHGSRREIWLQKAKSWLRREG